MIPRDWDEQRDWVINHPLEAADIVADAIAVADIFTQAHTTGYHTRLHDGLTRLARRVR